MIFFPQNQLLDLKQEVVIIPREFTRTAGGYFWVENTPSNWKNWTDAEAACQQFGWNVHLVTLDTEEVGTPIHVMLHFNN